MWTDIRSRLISSNISVISMLVVAFVTLLVVMRPLQILFIQTQLALEMRQVRNQLTQLPLSDRTPRQLPQVLTNLSQNLTGRLLLLAPNRNNAIIFDSTGVWQTESLRLETASRGQNRILRGTVRGPGNEALVYVATQPAADQSARLFLALVVPQPPTLSEVMAELGWWFFIAGLVASLIAVTLSVLIARSVANPLRAIANAAEAVAQGDYSRQVTVTGPDEVKQMARSFNSMTQKVQANQTAMRNFVSNASHELKTPLTSIQGFSQALRDGEVQDEASRNHYAGIIFDEAHRMRRLVEDLLDLARIDAGQIVIGKEPLDLTVLLDVTVNRLSAQLKAKNVTLQTDFQNVPNVVGNGDRLIQVFTNLIDNAIKHTPIGGTITLQGASTVNVGMNSSTSTIDSKRKRKQFAQVTMADTGSGIAPEDLKHIFERLYQVDKSRKRGHGIGLGLAIAHDIVRAHGGHIRAESVMGQGTQFIVWLPTKEADVTTLIARRGEKR